MNGWPWSIGTRIDVSPHSAGAASAITLARLGQRVLLVEQIVSGRQPQALSLGALIARPFPMDWNEQRRLFMAIGAVG